MVKKLSSRLCVDTAQLIEGQRYSVELVDGMRLCGTYLGRASGYVRLMVVDGLWTLKLEEIKCAHSA